jgi:hypothetical protein
MGSATMRGIIIHRYPALDPHAGSARRSGGYSEQDNASGQPAPADSPFRLLLAQEMARLQ